MTVAQLIKKLEEMPKNAQVGFASHDNSAHEVQGWARSVELLEKKDFFFDLDSGSGRSAIHELDSHPHRWVTIRC